MFEGQHFGRYEIRSKLGAGGMGEVYVAHDAELGRDAAVKILPREFSTDEERKSRFRQEARTVSSLNHPNIITIYETGENEQGSFLVTELVDGRTLREIIGRESISLVRVLHIAEQVATALIAAHSAHIVHRDIKPENIMLRRDGIVKVLDFGLAKPTLDLPHSAGDSEHALTMPGMIMGSATYMSPEQARGIGVDERTDIWSLGVVIYEMVSGRTPFGGATTGDTIAAVIYKEPEPLTNLVADAPPELNRILRKALQKDREQRYQTVKDLALDLKELLFDLEHVPSGERSRSWPSNPALSENPTLIHQTSNTNHQPTAIGRVSTLGNDGVASSGSAKWVYGLIALVLLGMIVLVGAAGYGLYRWSRRSVDPGITFAKTQVSRIETDGKVLLPAIAPDGKVIAYASGENGNRSLVVRQLATGSIITVVPPTNLEFRTITFSPTGDYIYYTQIRGDFSINTLYQVPALGGTPKKLIEDVDSSVTFAPGGKQFAFLRHVSKTNEDVIYLVDTDSLNYQALVSNKRTSFDFFSGRPAWSPDGKRILIGGGNRQGGLNGEMKVVEIVVADKTVKTIETKNWYSVGSFVWLRDGASFLFTGRESQASPMQIWRAAYPSGEVQAITNDLNDYAEVGLTGDGTTIVTVKGEAVSSLWRYSPAGKDTTQISSDSRNLDGANGLASLTDGRLIFTRRTTGRNDLYLSDADGKNPRALVTDLGYISNPRVSPDGRYIIFSTLNNRAARIWRADADGKNLTALTAEDPKIADVNPQITADGKYVVVQRSVVNEDRSALVRVPIEGGAAEPFYGDDRFSVFQPRLSRDGRSIAFSRYDISTFKRKLGFGSLNANEFSRLEKEIDYDLIDTYDWTPDSQSLSLVSSRSGVPNVWRLPAGGGEAVPVTDFTSGLIFAFAWSADGKSILMVRGIINNDLLLIRDAGQVSSKQ